MATALSHRVLALSASCIRRLAAVELAVNLTESQASEIAVAHGGDIHTAIQTLQLKIELHPGPSGRELAIVESGVGDVSKITEIRTISREATKSQSKVVERAREARRSEDEQRNKIRAWEREWGDFAERLGELYGKTMSRLHLLNLNDTERAEAESALDGILQRAIGRFDESEKSSFL
jgi:DNA polymerase III delta prime subunit